MQHKASAHQVMVLQTACKDTKRKQGQREATKTLRTEGKLAVDCFACHVSALYCLKAVQCQSAVYRGSLTCALQHRATACLIAKDIMPQESKAVACQQRQALLGGCVLGTALTSWTSLISQKQHCFHCACRIRCTACARCSSADVQQHTLSMNPELTA